jgi:hypothetical protein
MVDALTHRRLANIAIEHESTIARVVELCIESGIEDMLAGLIDAARLPKDKRRSR